MSYEDSAIANPERPEGSEEENEVEDEFVAEDREDQEDQEEENEENGAIERGLSEEDDFMVVKKETKEDPHPETEQVVKASPKKALKDSSVDMDPKSFERILELQKSLEKTQMELDATNSQKMMAQKKMKELEASLTKTQIELAKYQDEARKLKEDVKMKDVKISSLDEENKTLARNSLMSSMRKGKGDSSKELAAEDTLDRILVLESELGLEKKKNKHLNEEIKTLELTIKQKDKAITQFEKKSLSEFSSQDRLFEIEEKNSSLKREVEELKNQIKTLSHIQKMKTETIEKLLKRVNSLKDVADINEEKKKIIEAREREIDLLKKELKVAKESADEKDKRINTIALSKDVTAIVSLEHDKRYLYDELKKKTDKITTLNKTVQSQEKQIELLNKRMNALLISLSEKEIEPPKGEDLKKSQEEENKPSEGEASEEQEPQEEPQNTTESVPAAMYDLLQRGNTTLRKQKKNLETLMEEKDEIVESLVKKIEILKKQQLTTERKFKKRETDLLQGQDILKKQMETMAVEFSLKEQQLKKEKFAAKKKVEKLSQSIAL